MSEAATTPQKTSSSRSSSGNAPGHSVTKLQTDRGTTSIDDSVVAKIASIAAREVDGVSSLGGAMSSAVAGVVRRIRGDQHQTGGVGVEVGERQAAVDVTLIALYPASIPDVAESVRQNVISRIETLTGLEVVEVNVAVTDLAFPGGEESEDDSSSRRVE